MKAMKLTWLMAVWVGLAGLAAHAAPGQWEQPAAALADQIAAILGAGQARLTIRNLSSLPTDEIPGIRRLLERDLKARGVTPASEESANAVRVTLSENTRSGLWVAEIAQGSQTRVTMVPVDLHGAQADSATDRIALKKERIPLDFGASAGAPAQAPVLSALETSAGLLLLFPDQVDVLEQQGDAWRAIRRIPIALQHGAARDPRGLLMPTANASGVTAFLPGVRCDGTYLKPADAGAQTGDGWAFACGASDDPWTILATDTPGGSIAFRAFYNSARNYFTGIVSPSRGVDLPPFYSAAYLPGAPPAVLMSGMDGKVRVLENSALNTVSGVRDWGSELAALPTSCAGTVVLASASGQARQDSLRAYTLTSLETSPVSAPLAMEGTVTALWTAPAGNIVYAVVRGAADQYEVDRVSALCN